MRLDRASVPLTCLLDAQYLLWSSPLYRLYCYWERSHSYPWYLDGWSACPGASDTTSSGAERKEGTQFHRSFADKLLFNDLFDSRIESFLW